MDTTQFLSSRKERGATVGAAAGATVGLGAALAGADFKTALVMVVGSVLLPLAQVSFQGLLDIVKVWLYAKYGVREDNLATKPGLIPPFKPSETIALPTGGGEENPKNG